MTTITALGLVLLGLMVLVGGKQGWLAFLSFLLNFGFLYLTILLIALQVPAVWVAVGSGLVVLAVTIFMGEDDLQVALPAFWTACLVAMIMLLVIIARLPRCRHPVASWRNPFTFTAAGPFRIYT